MLSAPGAPHHVAKRPVGVTVKKLGTRDVSVKWSPLARLVNDPTKPHTIERKAFVGTRGRGRRARKGAALLSVFGLDARNYGGPLAITGVGPRASAQHPGTRGKHFAEKGKRLAVPLATETYAQKAMTEPLRQVFRG
jgi:hypothetical protein